MFQTLFLLGTHSTSSAHCSVRSVPFVRFPHNPQGTGAKFIPVTGGLGKMLQKERGERHNPSRGNCGFTCPCLGSRIFCNQGRRRHQPIFSFLRPPPVIPSYLAISCVPYLSTASTCTCPGTLIWQNAPLPRPATLLPSIHHLSQIYQWQVSPHSLFL